MIVINRTENGISIDGHAGYAENGKDIVCAAVSVLYETLINSLSELTEDRVLYNEADGHSQIYYEDLSEAGMLLVESFFVGVLMITNTYADYVTIHGADGR